MLNISFRQFLAKEELDEEKKNIKDTLYKLPKSHSTLVRGYNFKFQAGNTLKGDDQHVGYMDKGPKEICVAAPWNYGREFTILHEIAHRVWEKYMTDDLKKKWNKIVEKTKKKPIREEDRQAMDQSSEELFCMAYAATYSNAPPARFHHPEWERFIKSIS